jgi:AraC-like DNA-binding protein
MDRFYEKNIIIKHIYATRSSAVRDRYKNFVCRKGFRMFSRLFLVLNGKTEFSFVTADNKLKTVKAKKGDIVYLPDDAEYTSRWEDVNEIEYISIEFNIVDENNVPVLLRDEISLILSDRHNIMHDKFESFFSVYTQGATGYKIKCMALFFDILNDIVKENAKDNVKNEDSEIYKSILYLENNYLEDIPVSELSKMSNMCETGFRAKFKKAKGMSPVEYRNYLRIKRAAQLILNDNYTVATAAEMVNISDLCYFSKLFKRYMGTSPREYKRL